jgi:serine/threonine-protein kinase
MNSSLFAGPMDAGQRIGSYEVRGTLGAGSMGTVYLAEHTVIGRKAAIKVLKEEVAGDEQLVARFVNEARAANAVGHPGIVDVLDVGTLPGGLPYLVMEYLPGQTLAKRLADAGRLPVAEAVDIACQTAAAVGAAHDKGIVHRDLKPENIFLVDPALDPEGRMRVKVLDFSVAKLRGDVLKASLRTAAGSLLGTPAYMSPEQCRGLPEAVDHRSDVYSLGIILYEMLCGVPPFVSAGLGDLIIMQVAEAPVRPSARNPEVPASVEDAILRALAKQPEARFATMLELRRTLGDASPELPLSPRTPPPLFVGGRLHDGPSTGGRSEGTTPLSLVVGSSARGTTVARRRLVTGALVAAAAVGVGVMVFRRRDGEPAAVRTTGPSASRPAIEPLPVRTPPAEVAPAAPNPLHAPLAGAAPEATDATKTGRATTTRRSRRPRGTGTGKGPAAPATPAPKPYTPRKW